DRPASSVRGARRAWVCHPGGAATAEPQGRHTRYLRIALLAVLGVPSIAEAARPLLAAGIGAGVDFEPSLMVRSTGATLPATSLPAFAFEGEALWEPWGVGVLARGVGVDGSADYKSTGFDRLALTAAATWRPLTLVVPPRGWQALVLRRLAV